jgi:hypothetical protein
MCHAVISSNRRWWWYTGLFFGLMGLVRFQVVIALGAACVALLALTPRLPLRRRVVHALIVLVFPVCSIIVTVGWNGLVFKRWTMTTFKGRHLFERAFLFSNLDAGDDPHYAALAEKGGLYDPVTGGVTVEKQYWYAVYPRLRIAGYSCTGADALMGDAAATAIRRNPLTYLGDIGMNILLVMPGNLMAHDDFIPEPIWRQRTRPPESQNPWLVPGIMAGPPAETLARRVLFTEYYVPNAPPLPERMRQGILNTLLLFPEWNGLWIWFVLGGTLFGVCGSSRASIVCVAVPFWISVLFSVAVEGPVPRYYTALMPLALWLGLAGIERLGRMITNDTQEKSGAGYAGV